MHYLFTANQLCLFVYVKCTPTLSFPSASLSILRGRCLYVHVSVCVGGGVGIWRKVTHTHTHRGLRENTGGWRVLLSTGLNGCFVLVATAGRWGEGWGGKQHPVIMFLNWRHYRQKRRIYLNLTVSKVVLLSKTEREQTAGLLGFISSTRRQFCLGRISPNFVEHEQRKKQLNQRWGIGLGPF